MTAPQPQPLLQRIAALEAQLAAILKITGLSVEDWVSPHKAESLISLSRHQIKQLVDRAETARATDRRCTLQLGTHYRFVPPTENLQINWQRWEAVLASLLYRSPSSATPLPELASGSRWWATIQL